MTILELLAVSTAAVPSAAGGAPAGFNPIRSFLDADIVVKLVMAGLLLASLWVWTIIISFGLRIARLRSACARFEEDFWRATDVDAFHTIHGKDDLPSARVLASGVAEWRRSTAGRVVDREGVRQRLATAMNASVSQEADTLADRLNFLATVGSVAPFVGLFGTVWGIMKSFFDIGVQKNSSLAVVAPGISEALLATAIGLFAAIPAVIAYNRFSHGVNGLEARLFRFADGFHAMLSRELEKD